MLSSSDQGETPVEPKRGRGRPRKTPLPDPEEPKEPKKRGRPPKPKVEKPPKEPKPVQTPEERARVQSAYFQNYYKKNSAKIIKSNNDRVVQRRNEEREAKGEPLLKKRGRKRLYNVET